VFRAFSIDILSPEVPPVSGADVIIGGILPPPIVYVACIPFGDFGLFFEDEIDGFTYGGAPCVDHPPGGNAIQNVFFSVDRATVGVAPIGAQIIKETMKDGAAGDIFVQSNYGNMIGLVRLFINASPRAGVGGVLGLTGGLPPAVISNVDAWAGGGPGGNPCNGNPLLFTVDPVTAAVLGVTPGTILLHAPQVGIQWAPYLTPAELGLEPLDDVDALDANLFPAGGTFAPAPPDAWIYFSLAPGSPTLALLGASPGDILVKLVGAGGLPLIWAAAADLGLLPDDNLDALDIWDPGFPEQQFDLGLLENHLGHRCPEPGPGPGPGLNPADGPARALAPAGFPSPGNCTVQECLVVCPAGDLDFEVVVRDLSNNPVPGSLVTLSFTTCATFDPCPGASAYIIDFVTKTIYATTDMLGQVIFPLRMGGACVGGTVEVRADGTLLATRNMVSPDQDGSLLVDGADRELLIAKIGTADLTGDLDCDAVVQAVPATRSVVVNSSSLADPSLVGQPVPVQWAVNGAPALAGVVTGTVNVRLNGAIECSAPVGAGQCDVAPASPGTYAVTVEYTGDSNYDPSTSEAVTHQVNATTDVTSTDAVTAFALLAPWPAPAKGITSFAIELPRAARVTLDVLDIGGRRVGEILRDEPMTAGRVIRRWDPSGLPAGVYIVRARADQWVAQRRMIWLGR
jgi:hypothetical protein